MASSKLHSINIRVEGENPEAVEAMRLLIADAFEYLLSARGKTEISTRDKYKGNGLARMTATMDEDYIKSVHGHYKNKEEKTGAKRFYAEIDNLIPLVDWLKTKPSGECKVLIGGSDYAVTELITTLQMLDTDLAHWTLEKMIAKELIVDSTPKRRKDLTIGLIESDKP